MSPRSSQRGVALVLTLVLLAIVTVMAVLFLGVSRRERSSVRVTEDQTDARLAADAGLARAQAEIASRMLAWSNLLRYDLMVSTNFINPNGFNPALGTNPLNVAYTYANGQLVSGDDQRQAIANLMYSPRAPVFVPTNGFRSNDFRFYLDLNRNGRFETNGYQTVLDFFGRPLRDRGQNVRDQVIGDPEWIGVLQYPDKPHSATNRFVGRFAYIVLPAGKSLDLNYIHNRAKFTTDTITGNEGYYRNQGHGSWEINLAAFLRDLNTNTWDYHYASQNLSSPSTGFAFFDANNILAYRYGNRFSNLKSVSQLFGTPGANAFTLDLIDGYSRGLQQASIPVRPTDPDNPAIRWSGSDNPHEYYDVQHLFDTNRVGVGFTNRLLSSSVTRNGTYDRTTYYRLLAQLGTDSPQTQKGKIHLNYNNTRFAETNFVPWEPVEFFTNAAAAMIKAALITNVVNNSTQYLLGEYNVRPNLTVTNIMVYPFTEYSASTHRILQLAANIYDASTNRVTNGLAFPSVFRPVFTRVTTNIFISGYREVQTSAELALPWIDLKLAADRSRVVENKPNDVNVYGVPWVIGARKGLPNFNEYQFQTIVQMTRKLEYRKRSITDKGPFNVHQMYIIGVSNNFGLEAWNSYTNQYTRPVTLVVTNTVGGVLFDRRANRNLASIQRTLTTVTPRSTPWLGSELVVPMSTNLVFIPEAAYFSLPSGDLRALATRPTFDPNPAHPTPEWDLLFTNRVVFAAIDTQTRRVLDFVNLDDLRAGFNISTNLTAEASRATARGSFPESSFWLTNRASASGLPFGHTNQVYVSSNDVLSDADWASFSQNPISGGEKRKAIDGFRIFLGLTPLYYPGRSEPSTNLVMQVPFSPTRKFVQTLSWQANDPLVHYHPADLTDLVYSNPNQIEHIKPPLTADALSNIGKVNPRYQPWGGAPNKQEVASDFDLSLRDPLVRSSDDWLFPANKYPSIGWLGRVHRGSPWQTVYLKSAVANTNLWFKWAGSFGTHPTNDWRLLQAFTVAPNANAARGLMSVNQTNLAAWSAILSGIQTTSNAVDNARINKFAKAGYTPVVFEPSTPQLASIVTGIMNTVSNMPGRVFAHLGDILAVPELSVRSPFLNTTNQNQLRYGIDDAAYERIPQQILSLLKEDEPRMVVYTFGQALKPAGPPYTPPSIVSGGPFFGLCTNYQVTGETVTRTVLRVAGTPLHPQVVVEGYQALPGE